jgi:hypothetical protein
MSSVEGQLKNKCNVSSSTALFRNKIRQKVQIGEWSGKKCATRLFKPKIFECILNQNTRMSLDQ